LKTVEFTWLAARLLLAAVFLLAGATKLVDPLGSRKALRDFGLPLAFARPLVIALPILELMVAAVLIPASLAWYGAWGALALLTVFLFAIGTAMARGQQPDCHCFGQIHSEPVGWPTLLRNAGLAACAGWLLAGGRRQLGPDLWAWFITLGVQQRKIVVIAACALGFLFFRLIDRSRPKREPLESQPVIANNEETLGEPTASPRTQQPARTRKVVAGMGLPIGTPAPEFELPGLTGEKWSLHALREKHQDLMLIFTSPYCEPCQALAPLLVRWIREMDGLPQVVLISRGTVADNFARLKEFGTLKVLLQQEFEVAEAFDITSTPTAVLVSADGSIRSDLAMGAVAIKQLFSSCAKAANSQAEDAAHPAGNVPAHH
jgi:uncharacterized membrane protein YphA (DoxX/SURF4 family)/peroxiredoxin